MSFFYPFVLLSAASSMNRLLRVSENLKGTSDVIDTIVNVVLDRY